MVVNNVIDIRDRLEQYNRQATETDGVSPPIEGSIVSGSAIVLDFNSRRPVKPEDEKVIDQCARMGTSLNAAVSLACNPSGRKILDLMLNGHAA